MPAPTAREFIKSKTEEWATRRTVTLKGNGSSGRTYERVAFTFMPETNAPDCVYVVERLYHPAHGTHYRYAYWVISHHGLMKNRWVFGRFAAIIPEADMTALLQKARAEKTMTPA